MCRVDLAFTSRSPDGSSNDLAWDVPPARWMIISGSASFITLDMAGPSETSHVLVSTFRPAIPGVSGDRETTVRSCSPHSASERCPPMNPAPPAHHYPHGDPPGGPRMYVDRRPGGPAPAGPRRAGRIPPIS